MTFKKALPLVLILVFLILCLALFTLPAVSGNHYYEGSSGYKIMFSTVGVKHYNTIYQERIGFFGLATVILYFLSLGLGLISLFLLMSHKDSWVVVFILSLITTFIFSFLYIFIAGTLPKAEWSPCKYVTYHEKPKFGGGCIFTGIILGIVISVVSGIIVFLENNENSKEVFKRWNY